MAICLFAEWWSDYLLYVEFCGVIRSEAVPAIINSHYPLGISKRLHTKAAYIACKDNYHFALSSKTTCEKKNMFTEVYPGKSLVTFRFTIYQADAWLKLAKDLQLQFDLQPFAPIVQTAS